MVPALRAAILSIGAESNSLSMNTGIFLRKGTFSLRYIEIAPKENVLIQSRFRAVSHQEEDIRVWQKHLFPGLYGWLSDISYRGNNFRNKMILLNL